MCARELLVLRHGKSSWDSAATTDHDRPLAKRGRKDAARMGAWLRAAGLVPDCIIASTAKRARQTAERAAGAMEMPPEAILIEEAIYEAGLSELHSVLEAAPRACRRVMIVGHNPGFEGLVSGLAGADAATHAAPKFFPTCALAVFSMPEDWSELASAPAKLLHLVRPRNLPD